MIEREERKKDETTLMVLHLTENEGWSCRDAGRRFGMTKNAVIGIRNRIRKTEYCFDGCRNPENIDCGMSPLWWRLTNVN
jgi:hypothetical protein